MKGGGHFVHDFGRYPAAHRHRPVLSGGGIFVPHGPVPAHRRGDHGAVSACNAGVFHAHVPHGRGIDGGGVHPVRPAPCPGGQWHSAPGAAPCAQVLFSDGLPPGGSRGSAVRPHLGLSAGGRPHPAGGGAAGSLRAAHRGGKPPQALFLRHWPGASPRRGGDRRTAYPGRGGAGAAHRPSSPLRRGDRGPYCAGHGNLRGVLRLRPHPAVPAALAALSPGESGDGNQRPAADVHRRAGGGHLPAGHPAGVGQRRAHPGKAGGGRHDVVRGHGGIRETGGPQGASWTG